MEVSDYLWTLASAGLVGSRNIHVPKKIDIGIEVYLEANSPDPSLGGFYAWSRKVQTKEESRTSSGLVGSKTTQ